MAAGIVFAWNHFLYAGSCVFLIACALQAVIPEMKLNNFRTNWNDGIALSALLEYCQPGLFPNWKSLDPTERFAS